MRRKLNNPYDPAQSRCFACSTSNPIGLHLEFEESDDFVHATWQPTEYYQGYLNVLHGGIIATLLDEIGAWCVNVKIGTAGVTSELNVKYLKPVRLTKGAVSIKAGLASYDKKNANLKCFLYDGTGKLCATAESLFFLYPEEIARKRFHFPGKEAF
ncbi:MAG: PaaI family thioesterase [Bacteroidales bacterium]|nr:PaaI family thioesterase [Bacteroidales bacterium]